MKSEDRRIAEGVLYTDQYQLTMAQLYFRMGMHEKTAQFEHFFRSYPDYGLHKAGYCICAGLEWLIDWMEEARFGPREIEFLRSQKTRTGKQLFGEDFLTYLEKEFTFSRITLKAIPEGRVVHPNTPITVVEGPLAIAQVLETSLLNHINFQTLIATRAARIHDSGHGQLLLEFGLRRAHDRGANAGARAALIGGADFTSNVGISHLLGFPPKGTQAHSMIQAFIAMGGSELDAFRAYADIYPDDCLLLVDTIDTLHSGIPNAIQVFEELRQKGHKPVGIRLDSGDLAYLSIQAARMLNDAGFPDTIIVLSNNLDELVIWQIITQIQDEAPKYGVDPDHLIKRLVYGVGTRLITSQGDSSLGGVYKLVGLKKDGVWEPAIKISDTPEKTPNPGNKRVWRIYDQRGKATADVLTLAEETPADWEKVVLRHPGQPSKRRILSREEISEFEPLLEKVWEEGRRVAEFPPIPVLRERRIRDVNRLDSGIKRLVNPHIYHVSLSQKLWDLKRRLIQQMKNNNSNDEGNNGE